MEWAATFTSYSYNEIFFANKLLKTYSFLLRFDYGYAENILSYLLMQKIVTKKLFLLLLLLSLASKYMDIIFYFYII